MKDNPHEASDKLAACSQLLHDVQKGLDPVDETGA